VAGAPRRNIVYRGISRLCGNSSDYPLVGVRIISMSSVIQGVFIDWAILGLPLLLRHLVPDCGAAIKKRLS